MKMTRSTYYYEPQKEDETLVVQKIEAIRLGKVRRAKLTYLRKQTGKQSRIEEERGRTDSGNTPAV